MYVCMYVCMYIYYIIYLSRVCGAAEFFLEGNAFATICS